MHSSGEYAMIIHYRNLEVIVVKKTLVTILIVLAVLLALGVAAAIGYIWYRDHHVFVEGDAYDIATQSLDLTGEDISLAYYEELKSKLPDCEIKWMVPFQDGKYANDTEQLVLKQLSLEDVEFIVGDLQRVADKLYAMNYARHNDGKKIVQLELF